MFTSARVSCAWWLDGIWRRTYDQEVAGSIPDWLLLPVALLVKLFTPLCLCHQFCAGTKIGKITAGCGRGVMYRHTVTLWV